MPEIAELTASLGIDVDQRSFSKAERQLDKFAGKSDRQIGGIFKRSKRRGRGGGRGGLGVLGLGGLGGSLGALGAGFGAGAITKDAFDFDKALTRLSIQSRGTTGSLDDLRGSILDVSRETGVSKEEVLGGAAAFVSLTGDGKGAIDSMETFARVSKASGASLVDIATSASALQQNLGIDASQMESAFSILIRGGKAGAVELKDFAGLMAKLTPQIERFSGGKGIQGLETLNALLQVGKRGAGTARQTATQLEAFFGQIKGAAGKLKKAGVNVFDIALDDKGRKVKKLKPVLDILDQIGRSKLAREPDLLRDVFGSKEAEQIVSTLLKNRRAIDDIIKSTEGAKDVAEDYARVAQSTSDRASKSWNRLKVAAAEAATPIADAASFLLEKGVEGFSIPSVLNQTRKLIDERIKSQSETRGVARSGVTQILTGEEDAEARSLRRMLAGDRSTDALADRGDFNLLDIVGRAAIAATGPGISREQLQSKGRQQRLEQQNVFNQTINAAADMDEATLARQVARETRKEMDRVARNIAFANALPDF